MLHPHHENISNCKRSWNTAHTTKMRLHVANCKAHRRPQPKPNHSATSPKPPSNCSHHDPKHPSWHCDRLSPTTTRTRRRRCCSAHTGRRRGSPQITSTIIQTLECTLQAPLILVLTDDTAVPYADDSAARTEISYAWTDCGRSVTMV